MGVVELSFGDLDRRRVLGVLYSDASSEPDSNLNRTEATGPPAKD